MSFIDETSLYDILEIRPDASPQEVREAYLRTKAAYNKDSLALYTLISSEEREDMLGRIQRAYEVLSNEEQRKQYDRNHGLLDLDGEIDAPVLAPEGPKIVSIDRVPPMESTANSESLLVAPRTDFAPEALPASPPVAELALAPAAPAASPAAPRQEPQPTAPSAPTPIPADPNAALAQEIAQEAEWRGAFLRYVREKRRISLEEMSNITKVSKTYLTAVEEENYSKLPAPVFLRGFVTQMAKLLRLPHEQVVSAYMARHQAAELRKTAK